ncbi:MAG: retron Ec48 family effector membrane protein [Parashewanella sp.]
MKTESFIMSTKKLKAALIIYMIFVLVILIFKILYIFWSNSFFSRDFCLEANCIDDFFIQFKGVVSIIEFFGKLIIPLVTGTGVYLALKNYINTTETSRLSVHLSHQNTFKDYLLSEIEKETQISAKSIDVLKWYNLAFPHSRNGSIEIGKDYLKHIDKINTEIGNSNALFTGEVVKVFRYNEHQTRIINELRKIGIYVDRMPKKDFFEVENELFQLMNKVNRELCRLDDGGLLQKRQYS